MIDKLLQNIQEAGSVLREQANQFSTNAKEKTSSLIDEWLEVFPQLEVYGLKIESFALGVGLSPSLEVDLKGSHVDFKLERLDALIAETESKTALRTVLSAIRMTYKLHRRTYADLREPLIVKINVKLSPEVKVYIGEPLVN